MAATISSRTNHFISHSNISRLQTLIFNLQRLNHTCAGDVEKVRVKGDVNPSTWNNDYSDMSYWRVARYPGIDRSKISESARVALNILRRQGAMAYLVGGCVRDLLLDRIPKDFDVITSAKLTDIKMYFRRARVVGQRFPICLVYVKGSMVEVSSFETVARDADGKERVCVSQGPAGCNEEDFVRWQNSLRRDFTVNSLFYDPFANKIYDYTNGMRDLKLCKVQTVIPAHLSFKEDSARILRGIRIAARLGLSFSEETAAAIQNLYLSILDLNESRLMLEMNYLFSYGAAASSLCLLERFKILEVVLPFHATYLSKQGYDQTARRSSMLVKLFSSMDKLIACDRPCTPLLWIGLLAFHLALANNPQDALVIWAFSSVLYHGKWKAAVNFARERSHLHVGFAPEISESVCAKSDEALGEDVSCFVSEVISSINTLTGLVCISEKQGHAVERIFNVLLEDIETFRLGRRGNLEIDYKSLKNGNHKEIRFVLGKIIMDTMNSEVVRDQQLEVHHLPSLHLEKWQKEIKRKNYSTISSDLEQRQEVENDKGHLQRFIKTDQVVKEEKNHEQKLNADSMSSSHWKQKEKKDKPVSMSIDLDQQQVEGKYSSGNTNKCQVFEEKKIISQKLSSFFQPKTIKNKGHLQNLSTRKLQEDNQSQLRQNQQVINDDEHHQSESNREQQLCHVKNCCKLSTLFM